MSKAASENRSESLNLYHCSELVTQFYDAMFQAVLTELQLPKIGAAHGHILWELVAHGAQTMSQLARRTHRTKPNVTVAIDKLIKAGLVSKTRSDTDARRFIVDLTDEGRRYAPIFPILEQRVADVILGRITATDRRDLVRVMQKIAGNLED